MLAKKFIEYFNYISIWNQIKANYNIKKLVPSNSESIKKTQVFEIRKKTVNNQTIGTIKIYRAYKWTYKWMCLIDILF